MSVETWNESGRLWEEDHGLLDADQVVRIVKGLPLDIPEPMPGAAQVTPREPKVTKEPRPAIVPTIPPRPLTQE